MRSITSSIEGLLTIYADPFVDFSIYRFEHDTKKYIVIKVQEFERIPVICKKNYQYKNFHMKKGEIYTRSYRKPETIAVPSHNEMREIIDIATEKNTRELLKIINNIGISTNFKNQAESEEDNFYNQIKDLIN